MIPCIEDKCLKFPVCKHKEEVDCDILHSYVLNTTEIMRRKGPFTPEFKKWWHDNINSLMTYLKCVGIEQVQK